MKTSATYSGFSEPITKEVRFKHRSLKNYNCGLFDMIDIATRSMLRNKDQYAEGGDLVVAQQVLFLVPGLSHLSGEGSPRQLSNDKVCVKVQVEPQTKYRQIAPKPDLGPVFSSNATGEYSEEKKSSKAHVVVSSEEPEEVRRTVDKSIDVDKAAGSDGPAIKEEDVSPVIISDDDSPGSKPVIRDARRKRKNLTTSNTTDADELGDFKPEFSVERQKRNRKAPDFLVKGKGDESVAQEVDDDI
ncbi:MAG: hypothetical protein Q9226_009376 [Calogaya cf. arnoldii]